MHLAHGMYPDMFQDNEWEAFIGLLVSDVNADGNDYQGNRERIAICTRDGFKMYNGLLDLAMNYPQPHKIFTLPNLKGYNSIKN